MKYNKGKPFFDVIITLVLLGPLAIVGVCIVIGYAVQGSQPILFRQTRMGQLNKPFVMYKFRSLHSDATKSLKDRRFAWGNFLRATNLDELPQVINILKGEMSWVGPRPLPVEYQQNMTHEQNMRHRVKPGITGLVQVAGKNSLSWEGKFFLDVKYVEEMSFWGDLKIMIRTVLLLISFKKDISLDEKKFSK